MESNVESNLQAIINEDETLLKSPGSRVEKLLVALFNKIAGKSGSISSALDEINGEDISTNETV